MEPIEDNLLDAAWQIKKKKKKKKKKWPVRPAKIQISPVWSMPPSLCRQWVFKEPRVFRADSEDSD